MNKLAVFDLDGTVWKENSHVDIVNKYYKYGTIIIMLEKVLNRIMPGEYMQWLNNKFNKIPNHYIAQYNPTVNTNVLQLEEKYKENLWNICFISNAPLRIVQMAEERFGIKGYHADVGEKANVVENMSYDELHIVTDNISDLDIIEKAQKAIIIITKNNKKFFTRYIKEKKVHNLFLVE